MEVAHARINLGAPRELVFAAVQLAAPALSPITANRTYEWSPEPRVARIQEATLVLDRIFAGDIGKKPDLLAFAEYSLPRQAHDQIPFQELADRYHCIIVPGSYFDADPYSPLRRNNVCHIYLPGEASPLVICKKNPATEEQEFLLSSASLPNAARLVWEPPGREAVSISIFLCRDYLIPFRERQASEQVELANKSEHISQLDWEREGINVVLMHNDEPALFEGGAAFDVRRTRGKRKLVLFVNSANKDGSLGTALLGPSISKSRERDIAAKMPSYAHGVLVFETTLWEVVQRTDRPDTEITYPIKHWDAYSLPRNGEDRLTKFEKEVTVSKRRGIFHPAFLGAYQKCIVVEFFVARSIKKVEEVFKDGKIGHVTASHVRGIEDVVIRRYIQDTGKLGNVPSISQNFSVPHSRLSQVEFNEAFDTDPITPYLRVLIVPQKIRKFRGVQVPNLSNDQWVQLCSDMTPVTRRPDDLKEIVKIANDLPPGAAIPARYQSVFSLGIEEMVSVGRESGNRETFLFVSSEGDDRSDASRRLSNYLDDELMVDPRVRDIFDFDLLNVNPAAKERPFQVLMRLKCTVFDADEIITRLREWGSAKQIRVGTRSYDVFKHIARSGTQGIFEASFSKEEVELQKALCAIAPEFVFEFREIQDQFAEAIARHTRYLGKLRFPDRWDDLPGDLTSFLHHVCVYNCVKADQKKKRFREEAATDWNRLYKHLEAAAGELLANSLGLPRDAARRAVMDALKARDPEYFKEQANREGGFFKWFGDFYDRLTGADGKLTSHVREVSKRVSAFRNITVHGSPADELGASISINGADWNSKFVALDKKVDAMCSLLAGFSSELISRGLT